MSCSLVVRNLSCERNGKLLFENLSFCLGHKDKIAVMGGNGAGKTTLLRILAGLYPLAGGTIEYFHKQVKSESDFKNVRRRIGFLFQDSDDQFIAPTVIEEVAFGLLNRGIKLKDAVSESESMLERLGIYHLKDRVTLHLSGGEKKLAALASVLVTEPEILLLDEPSSGLDESSKKQIAGILSTLDKSMLIVSHDTDFVKECGARVMYLSGKGLSD